MSATPEWASLKQRLEALQRSVAEEIRRYPPPIPACDAHFNRLLELRRLLPRELARLELAAAADSVTLQEFVRGSPCAAELSETSVGRD